MWRLEARLEAPPSHSLRYDSTVVLQQTRADNCNEERVRLPAPNAAVQSKQTEDVDKRITGDLTGLDF